MSIEAMNTGFAQIFDVYSGQNSEKRRVHVYVLHYAKESGGDKRENQYWFKKHDEIPGNM